MGKVGFELTGGAEQRLGSSGDSMGAVGAGRLCACVRTGSLC